MLKYPNDIVSNQVETGDVFLQYTHFHLFHPVTWFSRIIRKCTKSIYNHTSEALWLDGELYMIEALGSGITLRKRDNWVNTSTLKQVKHLRMSDFSANFDEKDYCIKALRELDKKYDFQGIAKIFLNIVFGYWKSISRAKSESDWWCSEYTARMKELNGRETCLPKDFDNNNLFYEIL